MRRITSDTKGKADSWRASAELLALKNDIMKPYAEAFDLTNNVGERV